MNDNSSQDIRAEAPPTFIKLSPHMEAYCEQRIFHNKTRTDAYKAVYDTANMKIQTVYSNACRLDKNEKVRARQAEMMKVKTEACVKNYLWDAEKATRILSENINISKKYIKENIKKGKLSSAILSQITASVRELNQLYGLTRQDLNIYTHEAEQVAKTKTDLLADSINIFWSKAQKINPLYTQKKFVLLEGGRASGKSFGGADMVLYAALTREGGGTIICGREIQNSIKDSSKALLEKRINAHGLGDLFQILDQEIRVVNRAVNIIFLGLKEATRRDTVKGITNAYFIWVDEAQSISQLTIDKLIPTIIRNPDYKLIFTMNRTYEKDPVYIEMTTIRPHDCLHVKLNYHDNPYCNQAVLDEANLMRTVDIHKYQHIWDGDPMTSFVNSLWTVEIIDAMRSQITFDRDNYTRVEIGFDPATTNDEFSNEYGVVIGGLMKSGEVHIIDDISGHYNVSEVCDKIIEAYYRYKADCVTVETNQGGDWIKSMVLTKDNRVNIREVRAISGQDKITRAKPIANLSAMGRIKHINGGFKVLESQMQRMTEEGFKGSVGESPDRVDAYCWLAISLFDLTNMETSDVYLNISDFKEVGDYNKSQLAYQNSLYIHRCEDISAMLVFSVIRDKDNSRLMVTDYDVFDSIDLSAKLGEYLQTHEYPEIRIPLDAVTTPIINEYERLYSEIDSTDDKFYSKNIDDKMTTILPLIKQGNICVDRLKEKAYKNNYGNLFLKELTGYKPNIPKSMPILHCLCDIIFTENNLDSE